MSSEFTKAVRPEPLEDAILRLEKKYELWSQDKQEVFSDGDKDTYICVASELLET